MNKYETVVIVNPNIEDAGIKSLIEKFSSLINNDGKVENVDELGNFVSDDENLEITYDGRLLSNLGVNLDEIKLSLSFDIIITTNQNISYKGTISLDMPTDEIIEQGASKIEITDFSDIIFKRI